MNSDTGGSSDSSAEESGQARAQCSQWKKPKSRSWHSTVSPSAGIHAVPSHAVVQYPPGLSPWKNPKSRSWHRKASCPMATRARSSSGGSVVSFTPAVHAGWGRTRAEPSHKLSGAGAGANSSIATGLGQIRRHKPTGRLFFHFSTDFISSSAARPLWVFLFC